MGLLVTNNPMVREEFKDEIAVEFVDTNLIGILIHVRNYIHKGHLLFSHPLSGSIKPNETIYKTVVLSNVPGELDLQSVKIIEESVLTAQKFTDREIPEQFLHDMQVVDVSLIKATLKR